MSEQTITTYEGSITAASVGATVTVLAGAGRDGADGVGVPVGGATNQVLAKTSATDYATAWVDAAIGGGAVNSVNTKTGTVVLVPSDIGAQPVDSDLTAIAALTTTTFGRALLALADAAALRTAAGLGTAATQASTAFDASGAAAAAQAASQPLDSDLTAIAALATTTFGRSLLTTADAAATRTLIGAGTSSLALGTSTSTAKAGDYQPTAANISDATTIGKTILTAADAAAVRTAIALGTAATVDTGTSSGNIPLLSTGGRLPIARIASGTPDGTKFVRDDGTLAVPGGGGTVTSVTAGDSTVTIGGTGSAPTVAVNVIAESQVTSLVSDLGAKAPTASPTFTGTVTVPTATAADSSTKAASTAFVQGELTAKAPLASPTFTGTPAAPTVAGTSDSTTKISTTAFVQAVAALLAPLASPALTGNPTAPTQTAGNNSTRLATTAFVTAAVAAGGGGGGGGGSTDPHPFIFNA